MGIEVEPVTRIIRPSRRSFLFLGLGVLASGALDPMSLVRQKRYPFTASEFYRWLMSQAEDDLDLTRIETVTKEDLVTLVRQQSFTSVRGGTDRDLIVRVRDRGPMPIRTFARTLGPDYKKVRLASHPIVSVEDVWHES